MSLVGFKTRLKPNDKQKTDLAKHAGVARHAYNWGLQTCLDSLEKGDSLPSAIDLHKRLVAEVKSVNPWYYEVSKCAPQQALRNLATAFTNWWKHKHTSKPRFKKKGRHDSFYLEGSITVKGNKIKLPRIGWIRCPERLPCQVVKNVTLSRRAGQWYVSFKYELEKQSTDKKRETLGVDVGINSLITCSDGTVFPNPKAYRKAKKKLKKLHRSVSRKQLGSKNRDKSVKKLGRLHLKVANIRLDTLHKVTGWLAKNHSEIIIEDLNVSGLLKNHRLASAIADCGFYEFKRQLTYKCDWYGSKLVIADRFYPSSQICSHCNHRQKMPLKERVFTCSNCGYSLDRDRNASINLERWHLDIEYPKTVSYTGLACGESKPFNSSSVEDSLKQEVDIKPIFEQLRLFD